MSLVADIGTVTCCSVPPVEKDAEEYNVVQKWLDFKAFFEGVMFITSSSSSGALSSIHVGSHFRVQGDRWDER